VEPGEVTISSSELSLANGDTTIESLEAVNEDQKSSKTQAKNLAQELSLFSTANFNNVKILEVSCFFF
jgi:hypothetical protein